MTRSLALALGIGLATAGCTSSGLPASGDPGSFDPILGSAPAVSSGRFGFAAPQRQPLGDDARALVIGDLDGDGALDLVVTERGADRVAVLGGHGDGTFEPRVEFETGPRPLAVTLADLDLDGNLDAVVGFGDGSVRALPGFGDCSLGRGERYPAAADPAAVAVADFDGDGALDLAVADHAGDGLSVLRGHGDRSFDGRVNWDVKPGARSLVVADLDRDGKPDLVTGSAEGLTVRRGLGDATFAHPIAIAPAAIGAPEQVADGDFDHDGRVDLVVADALTGRVAVLLGQGSGNFRQAASYDLGRPLGVLVVADLDGDGALDVLTAPAPTSASTSASPGASESFAVLRGDGHGGLGAPRWFATGAPIVGLAVADLDRDGRNDVVVLAARELRVLLAN